MLNTSESKRRVPVTCNDAPLPTVGGLGHMGCCLDVLLVDADGGLVGGCVTSRGGLGLSDSSGHSSQSMVVLRELAVSSG